MGTSRSKLASPLSFGKVQQGFLPAPRIALPIVLTHDANREMTMYCRFHSHTVTWITHEAVPNHRAGTAIFQIIQFEK